MRFIIFFFILISPIYLSQKNIYVSNDGKDENNGTKNLPVYSLQRAFDLSKLETTQAININVGEGNYFLNKPLIIDESYTRSEKTRISVIGDKKNLPVFYGGKILKPISHNSSDEWIFNVEDKDNGEISQALSVDGEKRKISKFPSNGFLKPLEVSNQDRAFTIKIPYELNEQLKSYSDTDIKNVFATFYVKWTTIIRYIDKHDYQKSIITFKGDNITEQYAIEANKTLFTISNIKKKLQQGEWYYRDVKTIVYKPFLYENVKKSILILSNSQLLLDIKGLTSKNVSHISFENLSFNTAGEGLSSNGYYPYQAAVNVKSAIDISFANNVNFTKIFFKNINNNVFWIKDGCYNISIRDGSFIDLAAGAIKIGNINYDTDNDVTHHIKVSNNIFKNGGDLYPDAVPILILQSHSNNVSYNTISDFLYTGISVGWIWGYGKSLAQNNTISYNHIYNLGKGILDDMGGIYTLGISYGTIIDNNVIHDIKSNNYGGWGIYTDEGSSGITIKNNLVYNCSSSGFHQHYGENNLIENNIFAFNKKAELEASRLENHISFTFKNNIIVHDTNTMFAQNWSSVNKKSYNNIFFSMKNNINPRLLQNEINFHIVNPSLEKKDFYYLVKNKSIYNLSNFKEINFEKVGAQ